MKLLAGNKLLFDINSVTGRPQLSFYCEGCHTLHTVWIDGPGGWRWNQSPEQAILTPSVLVTSGHYVRGFKQGDGCWCTYRADHPDETDEHPWACQRCHSFIGCNGAQPGEIIYLSDTSHALAGKTLPLALIPETYWPAR